LISDGNGLSHRVRADSNTIRDRALLHSEGVGCPMFHVKREARDCWPAVR
jgi:hypothetical protein